MTKRKERVDEEGQVAQNLMAAAGRRDDLIQEGWLGWHEFLCQPPKPVAHVLIQPSGRVQWPPPLKFQSTDPEPLRPGFKSQLQPL